MNTERRFVRHAYQQNPRQSNWRESRIIDPPVNRNKAFTVGSAIGVDLSCSLAARVADFIQEFIPDNDQLNALINAIDYLVEGRERDSIEHIHIAMSHNDARLLADVINQINPMDQQLIALCRGLSAATRAA